MIDDPTVKRRAWHRGLVRLPAQYFIKNQSARYGDCVIVNFSRNGAGVLFPPNETLEKEADVLLDLVASNTFEQFTVKGRIIRVYQDGDRLGAAIHFEKVLSEAVFLKLWVDGTFTDNQAKNGI